MSSGRFYALCFGFGLCGSLAWACSATCDCEPVAERPAMLPTLHIDFAESRGENTPAAPAALVGGRVDVRASEVVVTYSSGLADYTQEDLFAQAAGAVDLVEDEAGGPVEAPVVEERAGGERQWRAGHDVRHAEFGHGWVQGSGLGRVTVRFETPDDVGPGRVRTFRTDDPELEPAEPLPLVRGGVAQG